MSTSDKSSLKENDSITTTKDNKSAQDDNANSDTAGIEAYQIGILIVYFRFRIPFIAYIREAENEKNRSVV